MAKAFEVQLATVAKSLKIVERKPSVGGLVNGTGPAFRMHQVLDHRNLLDINSIGCDVFLTLIGSCTCSTHAVYRVTACY